MRAILVLLALCSLGVSGCRTKVPPKQRMHLAGRWTIVSATRNGTPVAEMTNAHFLLEGSVYAWWNDDLVTIGTFRSGQTDGTVQVTFSDSWGDKWQGIAELADQQLTLRLEEWHEAGKELKLAPSETPRPRRHPHRDEPPATQAKPDQLVLVLQRAPARGGPWMKELQERHSDRQRRVAAIRAAASDLILSFQAAGRWPAQLDDANADDMVYLPGTPSEQDPNTMLLYERIAPYNGGFVAYQDGHVRWFKAADLKQLLAKLQEDNED